MQLCSAVLCWWLMWRDDGNLCFLQVKELSVEQPGEHFVPLSCSWGGLALAGGGCGKGGLLCCWCSLVGFSHPPAAPCAGSPCAPHPACQLHGLGCWAQGMASSPWFCCSVVSGWLALMCLDVLCQPSAMPWSVAEVGCVHTG